MKNERELRQLWDTACQYWTAANALHNHNPNYRNYTCVRVAQFYEREIPKKSDQKNASLLLAHLSSAAVRLCTIDERFEEDHGCRIKPCYREELKANMRSVERLTQQLLKRRDTWMHQMLRDNVAHIERSKKGDWRLRSARQNAIESLTIAQVLTAMEVIIKDFKRELFDKKII